VFPHLLLACDLKDFTHTETEKVPRKNVRRNKKSTTV
jgi:hypothetical protein